MIIYLTDQFVAGIFRDDDRRVQTYAGLAPPPLPFQKLVLDLKFPFYIVESYNEFTHGRLFFTFQRKEDAKAYAGGSIIYEIEKPYVPVTAWSDEMGNLPHTHLNEPDDD